MQQVGFFGVRIEAKQSEISEVEVLSDGSVDELWRYVLRFCRESYNWPDSIILGGGLDRTEDGLRLYIVERRSASGEERRAHGIPDSAENVMTSGTIVGSIEIVRVKPHRSSLICKSLTADCQRFVDRLVQKIQMQNLNIGDVLRRLPTTSGEQAEPQVDSGTVEAAKQKPRVPGRPKDRKRWQATWQKVRGEWEKGKGYKTICAWLGRAHPELACSPDILADIIRAGEAGELD